MLDFLKPKRKHAEAEVVAVRMTSPHMCCITLGGRQIVAFLEADGIDVPATWVKVHLPSGHSRAYTIRRIDRHAGTLDLEFVLHERDGVSGPASTWASQAQVGQRISIAGPRDGGFHLPVEVSWIILAGDATALPAMQAITQALPVDVKATMYAEVEKPEDHQIIESPAMLEIAWLGEESTPGAALHRELAGTPLPPGPGYIWIAGEAAAVRALRSHYLETLGVPRERVSAKGYWKVGEAAHRGG